MDSHGRQGAGDKKTGFRELTLDKINTRSYSIVRNLRKKIFRNVPRIYHIPEGIYIRWRDWEYIIQNTRE